MWYKQSLFRELLVGTGLSLAAMEVSAMQPVATMQPVVAMKSDAVPAVPMMESARLLTDVQIVISVQERKLLVMSGKDTLHVAPVAVPSGEVLDYGGRRWQFSPPAGIRTIRLKKVDPVWIPPDWHYVEVARGLGLQARPMSLTGTRLADGRTLIVRDSVVGLITASDTAFALLPVDEHIIFDSTLFIPPIGTFNRQLPGELGRYALDLGDGYMLHGTRNTASIGTATTHGCIRLQDSDLEWLYAHIAVGTPVYVR